MPVSREGVDTQAVIRLDTERVVGEISPLLFGGFAEHLGRCIYGGVYDPDSAQADEHGFRRDPDRAERRLPCSARARLPESCRQGLDLQHVYPNVSGLSS